MAENHQISSMLKLFEFLQSSCHSAAIQFPVSWMNFSCHSFVPVSNSSSIEKFLIKGKRPAPDEPPQNIDFNVDLTTAVAEDSGNESPVHLIESSDDENVARNNTVKENESLLFKCPRNGCKRMLCKDDPRDTQEHLDFHMAEDLASGRVQSGSSSGPKKQKLLTRFFKPVPPKQQQEQHQ